jgi:hypothetical protein
VVIRSHDFVVELVRMNEVDLFIDWVYFLAQYCYDIKEYDKSVFFSYQGILLCNYVYRLDKKLYFLIKIAESSI